MPNPIAPTPLYRIEECSDLMADGCLCDEQRNLIFLSVWGRDTAVQEFLARLQLGSQKDGLDQFHLLADEHLSIPVFVGNVDQFEKRTTRAFRRTLFGSMVHVWLFDKRCTRPDKANGSALAILPKEASNRTQRLWTLVQETCPLPLLDHWHDTVMALLQSRAMLSPLQFALGPLEGYRLALDVPTLTMALGELIRSDTLSISPLTQISGEPLRRAA
jgi:hypothetical protein